MTKAAEYFARLQQRARPHDAATMPLTYFIDLFLTDKQAERVSASYLRGLRSCLENFTAFLAEALEREPLLSDLTLEAGRAYALYQQDQIKWHAHPLHSRNRRGPAVTVSATTVQIYVRYVRTFASWLGKEEWTRNAHGEPVNILARLELPKAPKKEIRPLTAEEETRLARACDDRTRDGCRRLALLLLYLDTGARLNEIAGLRVPDVDFTRGVIHIHWENAKGMKERTIAFGAKTERALKRYGMVFRIPPISQTRPTDAFFLNPDGDPITGSGIYQMFKRMARRVGIARLHPHLLRHTAGTRDIERGKSTREVQNKLGHSSIMVTERYTHIVEQESANRRRDSHIDDLPISVRRGRKEQ